jgi:hypothetical protein
MPKQVYFTPKGSKYKDAANFFLNLGSSEQSLTNFQLLMDPKKPTLSWNTISVWPGNKGQNMSADHSGEVTLRDTDFKYQGDRGADDGFPPDVQDTPFIVRGIASALRDRLKILPISFSVEFSKQDKILIIKHL